MQEIGSGDKYRVAVDISRNRIFTWFKGDLLTNSDLAGLLKHTKTACDLLKPGLTSLADFTEVKLLAMSDFMREAQHILASSGVRKSATVWTEESFAKFTVDSQAQKVKEGAFSEKRQAFKTRTKAEAWPDKAI
jgi:hypothetical protein